MPRGSVHALADLRHIQRQRPQPVEEGKVVPFDWCDPSLGTIKHEPAAVFVLPAGMRGDGQLRVDFLNARWPIVTIWVIRGKAASRKQPSLSNANLLCLRLASRCSRLKAATRAAHAAIIGEGPIARCSLVTLVGHPQTVRRIV